MTILYPLFVVALFVSTVSAEVNLSIDCGTSKPSLDSNRLIVWTGDDTVISTGQPKSVSATYLLSSNSSYELNTLRAFPTGKKNCYILSGEKGAKVQLRAMFYYGNYDGEAAPPTFGLQFDGNEWATVETNMDLKIAQYYDVIYVTRGDNINVCLIQTYPNQIPFISAIQVRTLKPAMYGLADSGNALFLANRLSLSNEFIRSPTDDYDRFWDPMSLTAGGSFTRRLVYDGFVIDTSSSPDEPPKEVLKNAMTTTTSGETLKWRIENLPSTLDSVYLNLYFSEMTDLASSQKRAFSVYIGNTLVIPTLSGLVPPYGRVRELTVTGIKMSNATDISLVPTADSTEPPLVNAMEVFQISDYIVSYTSPSSPPSPPKSTSPSPPGSSSSSGVTKINLALILGVGIPVFVLVTAFLTVVRVMRLRRIQAAILGTGGGTNNGQLPYNYQNENQNVPAANIGQGVAMNEFTVNVEGSNNRDRDLYMPDQPYPSPAPINLNNPNN